ncbi:MAG: hypothetical protein ACREMA_00675 [Longimicrobiales bacterium]
MGTSRFTQLGGVAGLTFAGLWLIGAIAYLMQVGTPASMPTLAEFTELLRSQGYSYTLLARFLAILFVVPFALAARDYLLGLAPGRARTGAAFLFLYATLWFVWHATMVASLGVARSDPLDETTLTVFLTLVGTLGSAMFWAIAVFQAAWGAALVTRKGLEQVAGSAFLVGAAAAAIYAIVPDSSYQLGQIMNQLSTLALIVAVGILGLMMVRGTPRPIKEALAAPQRQTA